MRKANIIVNNASRLNALELLAMSSHIHQTTTCPSNADLGKKLMTILDRYKEWVPIIGDLVRRVFF